MEVVVGRVAKAHGIGGEVAVDVRTDSPEVRFAAGAAVIARLRGQPDRTLTIEACRSHSGRLLVRFDEVADRTDAEGVRGALLLADTEDLPPSDDPDEFFDHQLIGLVAELMDGGKVGVVADVVHSPGGELLMLDVDGREVLVPFVAAIVPTVDLAAGRIVLDPPEGLLDAD